MMTDDERAIIARILSALTDKGANPEYHERVRAKHRSEWPTLHRALDDLERWFNRT